MTKTIHFGPIESIELNELNRKNTYLGLPITEVSIEGFRFAVGLWPTLNQNTGEDSPVPALIVWTPQGWQTLALGFPFWDTNSQDGVFDIDIDVDVDGEETADDLKNIMWYLEGEFNPVISNYLEKNQPSDTTTVNLNPGDWDDINALLQTARFENGKLKFNWSL